MYVLLCTLSQNSLPYHVGGVDSNDTLYGGTAAYVLEVQGLLAQCVEEIHAQLEALEGRPSQSICALILLSHMVARHALTQPVCFLYCTLLEYISANRAALQGHRRLLRDTLRKLDSRVTEQREKQCSSVQTTDTLKALIVLTEAHLEAIEAPDSH